MREPNLQWAVRANEERGIVWKDDRNGGRFPLPSRMARGNATIAA